MEESKDLGQQPTTCCSEGSDKTSGSSDCCTCGSGPPRRSWKYLIAAVVLFSAVGLGAYSLVTDRASNAAETSPCCQSGPSSTTTLNMPGPAFPDCIRPAGCPGGSGACDGSQSACGACPSSAATAPTATPKCEGQSKSCCGK